MIVTQNNESWNYRYEAASQLALDPSWCGWDPTHVRFYNKGALTHLLAESRLTPVAWRSSYFIPYLSFDEGLLLRFRNFIHKMGLEKTFYFPDILLGNLAMSVRFGWSLQLKAIHAGGRALHE